MRRHFLTIICIAAALVPALEANAGLTHVCGEYSLESEGQVRFNANEKKLICGDADVQAWSVIPEYQAKYSISNFLQDRGYYYPEFEKTDKGILIHTGKLTRVTEVVLEGNYPEDLGIARKRHIRGKALTPAHLNDLEGWVRGELNNNGYPCAKVSSNAEASTGVVTVTIDAGEKHVFPPIRTDDNQETLSPDVLSRQYAFRVGSEYNQKLLTLSSRRLESSGMVQSSYFVTKCGSEDGEMGGDGECGPGEVSVSQKISLGKPRLFVLGVGADTEEIVKGKVSWKHSRLGRRASSIQIDANASYRKQQLAIASALYLFDTPSRFSIVPGVSFERRDERQFEYISVNAGVAPSYVYDNEHFQLSASAGPVLSYKRTYKGADVGLTRFLSGVIALSLMSHDYEYYDYDPRNGYNVTFSANLNSREMLSEITAQKLKLKGQWLINIGGFDPPLFVLGIRGALGTTITDENSQYFARMPPDFLFFLGGDDDLRGFKRQELPRASRGALTSATASLELRIAKFLPLHLEPILFTDFGALGMSSLHLDKPVYWSPGLGLRVSSLVGIFRASVSHGFMIANNNADNDSLSHWQYYFSYGKEF